MSRRALVRTAAALLTATGFLALSNGIALAADDVSWTVGTAANDYGADRPNYSYTVNPGGRVEDALVVANHGSTPLTLAVYAADAFTTDDGRLDLLTKDTRSTGVGAWVHPNRDQLTIPPGRSAQVPFTLSLPADAAPGDHLGGIVTSLTQTKPAIDRRLAIRIRVRVGGDLKPALSVENVRVHSSLNPFAKGDATVTYTVRNTGNAILTARQSITASAPFGQLRADSSQLDDTPQLLPGDTRDVTVPLRDVAPVVPLTTKLSLTPLLTDSAGSTAPLDQVDTTVHARPLPVVLALLLVLSIIAVGLLRVRRATGASGRVTRSGT